MNNIVIVLIDSIPLGFVILPCIIGFAVFLIGGIISFVFETLSVLITGKSSDGEDFNRFQLIGIILGLSWLPITIYLGHIGVSFLVHIVWFLVCTVISTALVVIPEINKYKK